MTRLSLADREVARRRRVSRSREEHARALAEARYPGCALVVGQLGDACFAVTVRHLGVDVARAEAKTLAAAWQRVASVLRRGAR